MQVPHMVALTAWLWCPKSGFTDTCDISQSSVIEQKQTRITFPNQTEWPLAELAFRLIKAQETSVLRENNIESYNSAQIQRQALQLSNTNFPHTNGYRSELIKKIPHVTHLEFWSQDI